MIPFCRQLYEIIDKPCRAAKFQKIGLNAIATTATGSLAIPRKGAVTLYRATFRINMIKKAGKEVL